PPAAGRGPAAAPRPRSAPAPRTKWRRRDLASTEGRAAHRAAVPPAPPGAGSRSVLRRTSPFPPGGRGHPQGSRVWCASPTVPSPPRRVVAVCPLAGEGGRRAGRGAGPPLPAHGERHALGIAGGALDPHGGPLVELRDGAGP